MQITGNSILDSDGAALRLENVSASLVSQNILRDDREPEQRSKEPPLLILGGKDNQISQNLSSTGKE
jgi:hypothetical protein